MLANDHTTGSNYEVLKWQVDVGRQEQVGHERIVGWGLYSMTEEDTKPAEMLWMDPAKERAHLDAECEADEVEQQAEWCQEAIGHILDATAKKIIIRTISKRLWNANIRER